jgi:hypothetical protein
MDARKHMAKLKGPSGTTSHRGRHEAIAHGHMLQIATWLAACVHLTMVSQRNASCWLSCVSGSMLLMLLATSPSSSEGLLQASQCALVSLACDHPRLTGQHMKRHMTPYGNCNAVAACNALDPRMHAWQLGKLVETLPGATSTSSKPIINVQ